MTPTATDDLPADLVERVNALSPAAKDKLFHLLVGEEGAIAADEMIVVTTEVSRV